MLSGKNLKVSVITVTLNSMQYIERAITSLLSQTYENIEFVIIDGGSTDGTLEILDKYRDKIDFFVTEHDKGLYDAMNKGINHSTGEILYFFNSDDRFYDRDVIKKTVCCFSKKRADFIYGDILNYHMDTGTCSYGRYPSLITKRHFIRSTIGHPATFFRRRCFEKAGNFDIKYKIVSDYEWFLRALFKYRLKAYHINKIISVFQCGGISTDVLNKKSILCEKESIQKLYFRPWELRAGSWLNFFLYWDFLRVLLRMAIGQKRYICLSNLNRPNTMHKKKILFLHVCLGRGGAERLRYILLKNIDRNRYDIKICCIGHKGEIGEQIEKLGYPVDVLGLRYAFKDIRTTLKIAGYLRREKPDILQTSLFDANFHGRVASLGSGIPCIITEEHSDHYQYKGIKYLPYIVSDFVLSCRTKYIVSCSEALRRDIIKKEKLPGHKVITIKNCIDPSMYIVKENRTAIRNRFSIRDEVVFITVASLSNRKGHSYLIDAFSEIKKKRKGFKCFFAGDGPLRNALYTRCQEYGLSDNVIFLGGVENIADYLNASDIFILPSLFEGLPVALIEAMYMGLPCVVTDVGANRELIIHEQNGIIVSPGNKHELENAILSCFENKDKLSEFGIINRKIAEQSCMVKDYVAQFYKLWDG